MKENSYEESIHFLDLNPKEGITYTNFSRPWGEEIIYFLLVDRFHDGKDRSPVLKEERIKGLGTLRELKNSYGGTIKGITRELDYITNLGCTAIWLSPLLENNPEGYHGYAIQNFLKIDPRFGSREDLIELIASAHKRGVKVFLDCVINHSGNNWEYKEGKSPAYEEGKQFEFGNWKSSSVLPLELRNTEYYQRKGYVVHWDEFPESQEGDFFSLKKFNHSESKEGLELQEILFNVYAYWIRETDCDGFRMDAAKHLGELPLARFSTKIKDYAKKLGKDNFFIFSEVSGNDAMLASFSKPINSAVEGKIYEPGDSFLDFPLHYILPKVVTGKIAGSKVFGRYKSLQQYQQDVHKGFFSLVTFLDNHDQIESGLKERIGAQCNDKQLIAALGLLFTLPGVPCIYYGTEQGFRGFGDHDVCIREAMFSRSDNSSAHNGKSFLYKEISSLLKLRKEHNVLITGTLNDCSKGNSERGEPLFFSRAEGDDEIFVVFNPDQENEQLIEFPDKNIVNSVSFLYGDETGSRFIKAKGKIKSGLILAPLQFSIFKVA